MTYKLAVDLATDRVIWFTSDLEFDIQTDERSAVAWYQGALPAGMTASNCWDWVLRDQQLTRSSPKPVRTTRLEQNREDALDWIRQQVFDFRHQRYKRDAYTLFLELQQGGLPQDLLQFLQRTETIKQTAVNKAHHAATDQDIADIRHELRTRLDEYATTLR